MSNGRLVRARPMPRGKQDPGRYNPFDDDRNAREYVPSWWTPPEGAERAHRDEEYRRENTESALDYAMRTEPDPRIASTFEAM